MAQTITRLLETTIRRFISNTAEFEITGSETLKGGLSGSKVQRFRLRLSTGQASSLIVKESSPLEDRVLTWLTAQGHACLPYHCALEQAGTGETLICLEDLGDETRPNSLAECSEEVWTGEAAGLAGIHARNLGADLDWLPRANEAYYRAYIEKKFWRPAWERALGQQDFVTTFGAAIPRVEAVAASVLAEMTALYAEGTSLTLTHSDINPGNVLVPPGRVAFVDWGTAHLAPFYLDVPHHFFTLELAEHYRRALETQGVLISRDDFAERYRVAARYIALRYLWWTLEAWQQDHRLEPWVRHYFGRLEV